MGMASGCARFESNQQLVSTGGWLVQMAGLRGDVVHWKQLGETGRLAQPALVIR